MSSTIKDMSSTIKDKTTIIKDITTTIIEDIWLSLFTGIPYVMFVIHRIYYLAGLTKIFSSHMQILLYSVYCRLNMSFVLFTMYFRFIIFLIDKLYNKNNIINTKWYCIVYIVHYTMDNAVCSLGKNAESINRFK